ncbi:MAG: hypothetical protein PHE65_06255 [Candidatus Omnitrophica bacterium]|nr:hypothetical protein [Candidatus Omnitrophota bacterium]
MRCVRSVSAALLTGIALALVLFFASRAFFENRMLRAVIERLSADSRIADIVVTSVEADPASGTTRTTIKFLEYDTQTQPLPAKYFTFSGNIIQFQSLVIRFDDTYVKAGHPLKGKSAYIFLKAFVLDDGKAESFDINRKYEIPSGYEIEGVSKDFQRRLWRQFWDYALDPAAASRMGVKNAQLEAPGTRFVPGKLYSIKIEHDGGMRIDVQNLPLILKGERPVF